MSSDHPNGSLPDETGVGEVVLRTRSAAALADFYGRVLGMEVDHVADGASLSAAGGEPLVTLREAPDAPDRESDAAGLYHVAFRVPDRAALADSLLRVEAADYPIDGAADHVASEAIYLTDPEGNGVELYVDRPRGKWEYTDDGQVRLPGDPLDRSEVTAHASGDPGDAIHPETDVGHVHLEVTDLDRATEFYRDVLGFNLRLRKPRAVFLAGGEYHHHLAVNTRYGRTRPYREDALGVEAVEFTVPAPAFDAVRERLRARDVETTERGQSVVVADPDRIPIVLTSQDDQ